ncbi:hypothetical protein K1719_044303 [Acacia pycnantha]|nr:hypothetical protein K1719_044303 [Acacia pycnantha]
MTVAIAKGIPLALEVLGSHFNSRDKAYWESELSKLKRYPHEQIQNILKISYDGLDPMDKETFLDIAFFGWVANRIMLLWARGLWFQSGTDEIEGIILDVSPIDYVQVEANIFVKMKNLRFLKIFYSSIPWPHSWTCIDLLSGLDPFPNKLRYLHWEYFPLETLPSGFYLKNLVELHMEDINVTRLWDGKQDLGNIKTINLCRSTQLIELPDLSMAYKLESVYLKDCQSLRSVHPSILSLPNIIVMYVDGCSQLESIKGETHLESFFNVDLQRPSFGGCSHLSEIPDNIKDLTWLVRLSLDDSAVETLPACVNGPPSLTYISLRRCKRLKSILGLPPFLRKLDASECTLLETVSSDSLVWNQCFFNFCSCEKLDERSLRYIQELILSSMTSASGCYYYDDEITCYPGSRVPEWMEYKPMTEAFNATKFTCNLERSQDLLICCVAPPHLVSEQLKEVHCYFSYDDNNKFHSSRTLSYPALNRDHVLLWPARRLSSGIGNDAKISCEFFLEYRDDEDKANCDVPAKACGAHLIYYS